MQTHTYTHKHIHIHKHMQSHVRAHTREMLIYETKLIQSEGIFKAHFPGEKILIHLWKQTFKHLHKFLFY